MTSEYPSEPTPHLVMLIGLPGAGKTTLANWLSHEYGFVVASRDTIRAAMFPDCQYTLAEKRAAFSALKHAIAIMLGQAKSVVTDGICFSSQQERQDVIELAEQAGARMTILACECPLTVAQARVEHDRLIDPNALKDRDARLVQQTQDRFDPLPDSAIPIDMDAPLEAVRSAAACRLGLQRK